MNKLIDNKEKLIEDLNKAEKELVKKEMQLKKEVADLWLGEEIKEKCSNDNQRKSFVTKNSLTLKEDVELLKLKVNHIKREINLVDDKIKYDLLIKGGVSL